MNSRWSCPAAGPLALTAGGEMPNGYGALPAVVPANDCPWVQPRNPSGSAGSLPCLQVPVAPRGRLRLSREDRGVAIVCPVGGPAALGRCPAFPPLSIPDVPAKEPRAGGDLSYPVVGGDR